MKKALFLSLIAISFAAHSQKFAIIGDYRCPTFDSSIYHVASLIHSWNPEFIVTTGDNYDLSCGTVDDQVGKHFSEYIYPYTGAYSSSATENNFWPCIGNHDLVAGGHTDYAEYFDLPNNERYYDIVIDNIHFFIINSNPGELDGYESTSTQGLWLQDKLETSTSIWKIVVFHHPPYSSGHHGDLEYMQWPFPDWGAHAVICGHEHSYERLSFGGIPYIINGIGGAELRPFYTISEYSIKRFTGEHGAMLVNAYTDSVVFECYTTNDSLVDRYVLFPLEKESISNADNINIYPNPGNDNIKVCYSLEENSEVEITLFDIFGNTISNKKFSQQAPGDYLLNLYDDKLIKQPLKPGIYQCNIKVNKTNYSEKIIITY